MKDEKLIKLRNYFELNLYEIKIWIELLKIGISGVGNLSKKSNVPRSRTYDTLESLKKKGFILLEMEKPLKYVAIDPNDVIESLKTKTLKKAEEKIKLFENIKTTKEITELTEFYKRSIEINKNIKLNGVINGRVNIHNYMKSLIKLSKKNILLSMNATDITKKIKNFKKELVEAKKRGVKIKILTNSNEKIKFLDNISSLINIDKGKKTISKFLISDESNILFLLGNKEINNKYDKGIWIKDEFFVKGLSNIINHIWEK